MTGASAPSRRVLLISPPWLLPRLPGLAIATLRPLLERNGLACDDLHASTLYPYTTTLRHIMEAFSGYFFVPHLYPDVDVPAFIETALERHRRELNLGGTRLDDRDASVEQLGGDADVFRTALRDGIRDAGICLDRIVAIATQDIYDIIGFSATFEIQLPATLALARRIRKLRPDIKIMLGGASCFEEQGEGLCTSFADFDAICHTEGEGVIVGLVRALRGEYPLSSVPGIVFRDAQGQVRKTPSPPVPRDLDQHPIPVFDRFLDQFSRSEWRHEAPARLLFETSRGCWWGQKHLCTFCGLNQEGLGFRAKSPERAYEEISTLYTRYPQANFIQSTDNILPMRYIKEVMPRLAALPKDPDRPLRMFFMIKSNLRRDQLQAIVDGGVFAVQPGIESFSDHILHDMDKGVDGIDQVQLVKFGHEVGLTMSYNLIIRNPGDRPEYYDDMTALLPFISHLPPPTGVTPLMLTRFSIYHTYPERFGITGARPRPHYRELYREPGVDLSRVAYEFEYDHPSLHDPLLLAAERRFMEGLRSWLQHYEPGRAYYLDRDVGVVICDSRDQSLGGPARQDLITGAAADVFRYIDTARQLHHIQGRFAHLDPSLLQLLLRTFVQRRWACRIGDRYLGVLPCKQRRAATTVEQETRRSRLAVVASAFQ